MSDGDESNTLKFFDHEEFMQRVANSNNIEYALCLSLAVNVNYLAHSECKHRERGAA